MPLYQFQCKKCDKAFEVFLRPSEASQETTCPYCQGNEVERSSEDKPDDLTPGVCGVKKNT